MPLFHFQVPHQLSHHISPLMSPFILDHLVRGKPVTSSPYHGPPPSRIIPPRACLSVFFSAHRSSSLDVGLASYPRKQFIRENSDVRLTLQGSLTRLFNPGRARTMRSESNTSSIHSRFMSFTVSFFHSLTKSYLPQNRYTRHVSDREP